ncbi:MAG: hypothetical protein HY744_12555 [Deltaproteobacteria bacterium]|nr:hypothetical protein [Deltaproteobacteria bacterium]
MAEARRARARFRWLPARFWLWAAVILAASFVYWYKTEQDAVQSQRAALLAKQRGLAREVGARWLALRDKVEGWTAQCAVASGDELDRETLRGWDFRKLPGIYLRLPLAATRDTTSIRAAAERSLHDAFTSCLLLVPNPSPVAGKECTGTRDCEIGEFCNPFKHCARYAQPHNLRLAYRTMKVLDTEWTAAVQQADGKLALRAAEATFDDAARYDIPKANELLQSARYFLLVVDEPSSPGATDAGAPRDEGEDPLAPPKHRPEPTWESESDVPAGPHWARVCVWRLEDGRRLMAIRREAAAELVGGGGALGEKQTRAQQRQASSCALALAVRTAMGDASAPVLPEGPP